MSDEALLDLERGARIGLAEAILCPGKTTRQIADICETAYAAGNPVLLTRLTAEAHAALPDAIRAHLDYEPLSRTAVFGAWTPPEGAPRVAIVTAGTSDLPAAREAARVLAFYGAPTAEVNDIGAAGLWRVLSKVEELRAYPVLIVCAGMDGALFTVLGGLVPGAIIALPTSTGYGIARGGESALSSALASCAPGIAVVNIDNGYGAACAAMRILRAIGGTD